MTAAPAATQPPPAARRELTNTLLVLYEPVLVPIVTGMLKDSADAFWPYVLMFPLVPGAIVPALLRLDGALFFVLAGVATLALFAGVQLASLLPPLLRGIVRAAVVFGVAFEAIGFANLLRA